MAGPRYRIVYSSTAVRDLKVLDRQIAVRIETAIEVLGIEPRPPGAKRLSGFPHWRIRVAKDYRVIYRIDNDILLVEAIKFGHRRDLYKH